MAASKLPLLMAQLGSVQGLEGLAMKLVAVRAAPFPPKDEAKGFTTRHV